jgi:hypothetical protein
MTAGNGLLRRVADLETWTTGADEMIAEFARDLTIMENKPNKLGPHAVASKLSMSKLPTTFTRRSSGSTERTALDASSLRLS